MTILKAADADFAANRARGNVTFDVRLVDQVTRRHHVHESGSMRVRFPSPEGAGLSCMLINTAGGVAGGDEFLIDIKAGAGTQLTLTTAAAEKVYRSHGPNGVIDVKLSAAENATIRWLPQETILFDRSRVERTIDISLHETASLVLCEMVVFGRSAMNERFEQGLFVDRWRLRRGGRLVFAENVRLQDDIAAKLNQRIVANGGACIGTALLVPGDQQLVEQLREADLPFEGEFGVSAWNGMLVARFCAASSIAVRNDMVRLMSLASKQPMPRMWMN